MVRTLCKTVTIGQIWSANDAPFALISGRCQLESLEQARMLAGTLKKTYEALSIGYVFKACYDKASRTSISGKRGPGMEKGLEVLAGIREEFAIPVLTDAHGTEQCRPAAGGVDIPQIPAFLCRQPDLLLVAGETGAAVFPEPRAGGAKAPLNAMKDWHKLKPDRFKKWPYYPPGWEEYLMSWHRKKNIGQKKRK